MTELTCEKWIWTVKRAPTGVLIERYRKKCAKPALRCTFAGKLTTASAVLCNRHLKMAEQEATLIDVTRE